MNGGDALRVLKIIDARSAPVAALTRRRLMLIAALSCGSAAHAVDNPDAPDLSAAFLARAQPHEERLSNASRISDIAAAGLAYAKFLDAELNKTYQELVARVGDSSTRRALVQSQREWLRFRDAEHRFIERNWTPQNFGTSYALSRAGYRHRLVKQRVLTLLAYLQNYP